jgi:hypothetical protein
MKYKIHTYEEAIQVIKEVGFLPLASLIPHYPSLDSITSKEDWYSGSQFDPWLWRTKFPVDGVAAYGKFIKKKSVLISSELLPLIRGILGSKDSMKERFSDGVISREAFQLYRLIQEEEEIDTRILRVKAGMKDKEKKKPFDNALLELQASMDIVVSRTKEKTNEEGEKNGWSSTSFETMENWTSRNNIDQINLDMEEAKNELKGHFIKVCGLESMKSFEKIFKFQLEN